MTRSSKNRNKERERERELEERRRLNRLLPITLEKAQRFSHLVSQGNYTRYLIEKENIIQRSMNVCKRKWKYPLRNILDKYSHWIQKQPRIKKCRSKIRIDVLVVAKRSNVEFRSSPNSTENLNCSNETTDSSDSSDKSDNSDNCDNCGSSGLSSELIESNESESEDQNNEIESYSVRDGDETESDCAFKEMLHKCYYPDSSEDSTEVSSELLCNKNLINENREDSEIFQSDEDWFNSILVDPSPTSNEEEGIQYLEYYDRLVKLVGLEAPLGETKKGKEKEKENSSIFQKFDDCFKCFSKGPPPLLTIEDIHYLRYEELFKLYGFESEV